MTGNHVGALVVVATLAVVSLSSRGMAQVQNRRLGYDELQERLDRLTRVAIDTADWEAQLKAINRIAVMGIFFYRLRPDWSPDSGSPRDPGIVPRLAQIYEATASINHKDLIVRRMFDQVEQEEAADFLVRVAEAKSPGDGMMHRPIPVWAIHVLGSLGEPGREALMELAQRDEVRNPLARRVLADLERHDWVPLDERRRPNTPPKPPDTTDTIGQ